MTFPARAVLALALLPALLTVTGCARVSPTNTAPFPAADGTEARIVDPLDGSTVKLENVLVVGTAEGAPGRLLGTVVNGGARPVTVSLLLYPSATADTPLARATVPVPGGPAVRVQDLTPGLIADALPHPPGAVLSLRAGTPEGGWVRLTVPVLAATGPYATWTATADA
ncbi:MAG: hypothetical protein P8Z68_09020 [Kineosporiaceae bacterium]